MNSNSKAQFIKVICKKCNCENVIFSRATIRVRCPDCGVMQVAPKGGKRKMINCIQIQELR